MQSRRITIAVCIALVGVAALASGSAVATGEIDVDRPDLRFGGMEVAGQSGNGTAEPTETPQPTETPRATGTARIYESAFTVERGGVATLRVHLEDTTEATVVLGGREVGENVTVTVTDGNGDGVVPLLFHTGPVGMDRTRFVTVDDADDYGTLSTASDPDGTLDAGDYPIDVYADHGVAGEPTSVATLVVTESSAPPNASIDFEGQAVTLRPDGGAVVEGTADLQAGRKLMVRLRSDGDSPFLKSKQATVGPEGSFAVTFDLTEVQTPANATVIVSLEGERLAEAPVEVVEAQEETESPGMPGFGVGAALAGLAAVALLANRYGN